MGVVSQIQSTPDRDRASKKALTSDFGHKDSNFSEEMQVFRKKLYENEPNYSFTPTVAMNQRPCWGMRLVLIPLRL